MTLEFPDKLSNDVVLTPARVKLETAAGLYASGSVTLGQGAELAGISQTAFLHELGKRKICVNYGIEDLRHDLQMIDVLHPELKKR